MKIVVTEPQMMTESVKAALAALGPVSYGPFDDRALTRALSDCEVLMVRFGRFVGKDLLSQAPHLRFLLTPTTGLDHIDCEAASAVGIEVISLRNCPEAIQDISATAEHTLGLMLAIARRTPAAAAHVIDGGWDRNLFWGLQLRKKRLGIIGYGRIGRMVGQFAAALGMEVLAFDRRADKIAAPAVGVELDDLLGASDILSIHLSATPENFRFINSAAVNRMKSGALFVNTARASLVDEQALADAVISGRLLGVATDVLHGEEERQSSASPLLACARAGYNVIITPHIGGATQDSIAVAEAAVVNCLKSRRPQSRLQNDPDP